MSGLEFVSSGTSGSAGSGGAFTLGPEINRFADATDGAEIVPTDTSKATLVSVVFSSVAGGSTAQLGKWNGNMVQYVYVPAASRGSCLLVVDAGDSYAVGLPGDIVVDNLYEQTIGGTPG